MAENLVFVQNGQAFTTSKVIAQGVEIEHESIMRTLKQYQADFETFGIFRFEIGKLNGGRGRPETVVLLNEQQATLLVTYCKNTEVVRKFKVALVKAFYEARQAQLPAPALTDESLSPAEQFAIRNAVGKKAKKSPSTYRFIYSLLKQRFQVARYSQISTYDFREALNFIEELKLPAPFSEPLPAPKPAKYDAEAQLYTFTISRRELERFGSFVYNWRYQFHDALVLYVNHLVAVKSPYSRKLYDATFDSSLQQLEELFREHGIPVGSDFPNPERLRTLAYSI